MIDIVIKNYFPNAASYNVKPFGNGHINDTYKVEFENPSSTYLLQRINTSVFKNPEIIIENHLKLQNEFSKNNHSVAIAQIMPDINGKYLYIDKSGGAWRLTTFFKDSYSIEVVDENWQAYQSGVGYGWFVKESQFLNTSDFQEPIKDFHRLTFRLNQLDEAITNNIAGRLKSVEPIIRFFKNMEKSLVQIERLIDKGDLPLRIVHNDTKLNNLLFRNNIVVAVIDLDTAGPGSIIYDYGDALRTSANNATEDEKKLEKVSYNLNAFRAFSTGYIQQVKTILTEKEKIYLYRAPVFMTYIMGIRFLADYLNGDIYYKTDYSEHNLDRCKVQKKLIESMESHEDISKRIILECLKAN